MKYEAILYEKHGTVAKVITNRPRYKDAQSRLMIEEMDHAFAAASADDEVRVIILAAAGDTFSSGHDIGTPEEKADMRRRPFPKGVRGEYALSRQLFLDTTLRWRDLDKPTIAQVQGMCIFGGWMFAAAMDLIVASEDARFLPALDAVLLDSMGHPHPQSEGGDVSQPLHRRSGGGSARLRQSGRIA
jgi:enoyl-CoA hydratase